MTLTAITFSDPLLERCHRGDKRAQLQIYNKYYKAMYNTALRIVKHSAEAEDIMQESFLKAFTRLESFQENSTFGAWLKRIVVNESINAFQKKEKLQEFSYKNELTNSPDDGFVLDEEEVNPKVKRLLNEMNNLKENYRLALTLHLIEGYDYEEICEIMKLSYANCRTTISRAKESLRKKMMNYEK